MICRSNMIPFGNGDYHKGLFIDGRLSVDFERELDKVTFGKCEIFPCDADLPCPYEDSSAQIFLHGSCDLFAKQLREKFNYDIYEINYGVLLLGDEAVFQHRLEHIHAGLIPFLPVELLLSHGHHHLGTEPEYSRRGSSISVGNCHRPGRASRSRHK